MKIEKHKFSCCSSDCGHYTGRLTSTQLCDKPMAYEVEEYDYGDEIRRALNDIKHPFNNISPSRTKGKVFLYSDKIGEIVISISESMSMEQIRENICQAIQEKANNILQFSRDIE